ncbi:hypothetical protein A2803_03560 [Candidatus Woesebacteria bacterium RIFCSPHIGHO2_01_FULL_44_21]|uniref:Type II secretion system protein GspG C-terminal domain-containing protein n=1 Tax=Candidatus Woesebacteria bacterium RIFCSPHIGHO2_01_FULL_44_21 TaxID=1802503 RepID=A0A1F7YYS2_9BACT|nr:MAG: hypothetical protein A2803_03560 [Candidatus Woesebacteria bacterium RIFCSPHIGHO2_01_FULL_44_21]OGM69097.1 MAG: hypothetical protein A2897_04680 [Candidatus Woesebacteria bacterium RIFCSPLOWO2_01_FULL_44_24b]
MRKGFTLLEVLVVIVIIIIVFSAMAFALGGSRQQARDERRKADLALIASGLEKYRADCGVYPTAAYYNAVTTGANLVGNGSTPACTSASVYMDNKPGDPESPSRIYSYNLLSSASYALCASLDNVSSAMDTSNCASCGIACNYITTNP